MRRGIKLLLVFAFLAWVAGPALGVTVFEITATVQVRPGDFDPESPDPILLNTRIKGTAHMRAVLVDPGDKGKLMSLLGDLEEYHVTSCGGTGLSVGTCFVTVPLAGQGHVIACSIPPTGFDTGDCDVYYKARATGAFFINFETFSSCGWLACDCT